VNTTTELTLSDEYTEKLNILIESGADERAIADLCADYERELDQLTQLVNGPHVISRASTRTAGRVRRRVSRALRHADR